MACAMFKSLIPYTCVYMDCDFKDLMSAVTKCLTPNKERKALIFELQSLWTSHSNPNPVMPCLSVRSGLDLYLTVMNFKPGSEVIMSAINIPSMTHIVKEHGLKVIPLDVNIENAAPKIEKLADLRTDKTVAILVAHLYGKLFDMEPIVKFASEHKLVVIEDAAEAFCGFRQIGHPKSDIALFSFGVIKYYTSFGGAIAKIRDREVYEKMHTLLESYPIQSNGEYLKKVLKYFIVWLTLDLPSVNRLSVSAARFFGVDHKAIAVSMLRGFPEGMMVKIKQQPSTSLLQMMVERQNSFNMAEFCNCRVKGQYVQHRLPEGVEVVGGNVDHNNYWLFPVLVENPDHFVESLNILGVDAYRGATQLNIVEPENGKSIIHPAVSIDKNYPHEAKFLIDHVVYLPINKNVPFNVLDRIINIIKMAVIMSKDSTESHQIKLMSKL